MKICGIICEYNPFHNGHLKQIDYIKHNLNYDYVVIAISGNFSQRAIPCIVDKYSRCDCILNADMVCQIPTAYSVNNGEVFAIAGVRVLAGAGVDSICFGVETLDEDLFFSLRDFMLNESDLYKKNLQAELNKGLSFNEARINSIINSSPNGIKYAELLSKPNNILALEYLKAIKMCGYNIKPIFMKRDDNFSLAENVSIYQNIASATTIRNYIENNKNFSQFVPHSTLTTINEKFNPDYLANYKRIAFNILLNSDKEKLKNIYLVSEGIENRILQSLIDSSCYDELIENIVTKRYDKNKIMRIILNYILGITKDIIDSLYKNEFKYIKVLMVNPDILKFIRPDSKLIVRKNDIENPFSDSLAEIENKANLIANKIFGSNIGYNDLFNKAIVKTKNKIS